MNTQKGKILAGGFFMALLAGCATGEQWDVPEPSVPLNAHVEERCYTSDVSEQNRSGAGFYAGGPEHYFQYECDNYQIKESR